jgi:hypothetical protein
MKKNTLSVCGSRVAFVSGSKFKSKKKVVPKRDPSLHQQLIIFYISRPKPITFFQAEKSINQGFPISSSRPIRFLGAGRSANQVLSRSRFRPIRFLCGGNSANQIRSWSGCHPIRLLGAGKSANQVLSWSRSRQIKRFRDLDPVQSDFYEVEIPTS